MTQTILGYRDSAADPELIGESVPNHAYHADADRRSWAAMLGLFEDVFATAMR